ncbi:MAG: hypothetical protein Q8L35_05460 [Actinomycetota bacterium]|nr:hypothetical protein [Actinomycetota bacterium]
MLTLSGLDLYLRWLQLFVSLAFPLVVGVVLLLAWLDFHRWVNHQIDRDEEDERLTAEVKEFIE